MKASELIEAMQAAGAPMEAVLIALREIEARDDALEQRRAADRERKRRQRDTGETVTGQSRDTAGTVTAEPALSRPPNENNLTPPPIPTREIKTPRARACRLPLDWQPEAVNGDLGVSVTAWPAGAIERELARFRDWAASASGPNAVKLNWQSAWRNWLRKVEDDGRYTRKPNTNGSRSFDGRDGVARALDRRLGLDDTPGPAERFNDGEGRGHRALPAPAASALR